MVDFGMRNDDEFYNKMRSSTAVSTETASTIAMDGICEGGYDGVVVVVVTAAVAAVLMMMMMGISSRGGWQWWFRYKSWCANYILNILCCQRKRKQNHIDYEAANTFQHNVSVCLYSTGDELKHNLKFCGVNGISVYTYKSWSERLNCWIDGSVAFGFCIVLFSRGIIFIKKMRNSKSLKQMWHVFVACFTFNISSFVLLLFLLCRFHLFHLHVARFSAKMLPSHLPYAVLAVCSNAHAAPYTNVIFNFLHQNLSVAFPLCHCCFMLLNKRSIHRFRTSAFHLMPFYEFNCLKLIKSTMWRLLHAMRDVQMRASSRLCVCVCVVDAYIAAMMANDETQKCDFWLLLFKWHPEYIQASKSVSIQAFIILSSFVAFLPRNEL